MIEITIRDTESNFIEKSTGDLAYFAVVNENGGHGTIKGKGPLVNILQLYTALEETRKILESENPIIKILEGFCHPEVTSVDLSPIEKMKKEED